MMMMMIICKFNQLIAALHNLFVIIEEATVGVGPVNALTIFWLCVKFEAFLLIMFIIFIIIIDRSDRRCCSCHYYYNSQLSLRWTPQKGYQMSVLERCSALKSPDVTNRTKSHVRLIELNRI